jgi:environmental stress-induced protein Ves
MNWNVIHLDDVRPTPWRNGGGTTRELFTWPDPQQWRCRASVAQISQAGVFSSFPGVQRWFAVLEGDGVRLKVGAESHTLKTRDEVFGFDGAAKTSCELLGGETQDFNLMLRDGVSAKIKRVLDDLTVRIEIPKMIAVYANKSPATVIFDTQRYEIAPHSFAWTMVDQFTVFETQATDALWMEIST